MNTKQHEMMVELIEKNKPKAAVHESRESGRGRTIIAGGNLDSEQLDAFASRSYDTNPWVEVETLFV